MWRVSATNDYHLLASHRPRLLQERLQEELGGWSQRHDDPALYWGPLGRGGVPGVGIALGQIHVCRGRRVSSAGKAKGMPAAGRPPAQVGFALWKARKLPRHSPGFRGHTPAGSEDDLTAQPSTPDTNRPVALQRTDRFVGRAMNWMYHHLRRVPRYRPVVMTNVLQNRTQYPDLEAFDLPWKRLGSRVWKRLARARPYPPDLARAKSYRPVVLHSHFGYMGVDDLPLHRALGLPWLVGFYGADVYLHGREPEWQERYAELFERLDLALALGPAMEKALVELGCPADKVVIHPLGVDVEDVPSAERYLAPGNRLEVLFAGTFREKKGVVYLLEAADLLRRRGVDFRLHLVGEASERSKETGAEILATIARLGLESQIERYHWLPFQQLTELALRCHLFVAPSVTARDGDAEGTPFVIQQMMLTGMPVISTEHSDIPYLYGELADRLVPERDAAALADKVQEYAERPELIQSDGLAMRRRMLGHFDIRDSAAHLADLYDRVAS